MVTMTMGQNFNAVDVEFENVQFLRATTMTTSSVVLFTVVMHIGSGAFEVSEGTSVVMTGTVRAVKNGEPIKDLTPWIKSEETNIMDHKDFYKELRLRGYHYADLFKSIVEVKSDGSTGKVKWQDNWPAFMDCMLQVNILQLDSRALYIPTHIRKIRINTQRHLQAVAALDPENRVLEVKTSRDLNMVTCGGIEMEGLVCRSIGRRKPPGIEVFESYEFVPLNCDSIEYPKNEAVAILLQLGLENLVQHKLKVVEIDETESEFVEVQMEDVQEACDTESKEHQVVNPQTETKSEPPSEQNPTEPSTNLPESESKSPNESEPIESETESEEPEEQLNTLIQTFDNAIQNIPLVTGDLILLCKQKVKIDHVEVANTELKDQTNCHFIIASNWLKEGEKVALAQKSLVEKGFLVLRENRDIFWNEIQCPEGFSLISVVKVPDEALILLQRIQPVVSKSVVNVDSNDVTFEWLTPLKESIKGGSTIVVERSSHSGIMGLVNCIRREPDSSNLVRCVLIDDKTAPPFDLDQPLYADQLNLDLPMNVYKNGKWGTYRHIELRKEIEERCHDNHCFANVRQIGNLSSFEWATGWLDTTNTENLVNIQYSAINFRDIMLATGRLQIEAYSTNRLLQQCFLGLEFSGISEKGERIMVRI